MIQLQRIVDLYLFLQKNIYIMYLSQLLSKL